MEVLTLKWEHVDQESGIANFQSTKTDQPRKVPYGRFPQLREVIERRLAARKRLGHEGVISPWVFCFEQPVKIHGRVYHPAGAPLFGSGEHGLHTMLRENLDKACKQAGVLRLLFHDFRRSAARNFERAAVPRSGAPDRRLERSHLQPLRDRRRNRTGIRAIGGRRLFAPSRLALWWH